ncbi:recombinase family protein [Streptomyces sp. NPDC007172]|uniref:recombinase family protein n=1 Tax=Streptomyces sp. NPDC007172 TaxID=3364776 RepID=UPI00367A16B0
MARISIDADGTALGVNRQHGHCDAAAEDLGWAVVYRYTDNDLTAADPDVQRPGFLRMIRDLRARQTEEGFRVCGVLAVEEERVVRLPEDYLKLYRALTVEEDGLLYYTDKKQLIDVYSEVEQTRGLMSSSMGENEVRKIKRRVKRSISDRAKEGRRTGGQRRFGWLGVERDADGIVTRPSNKYANPAEWGHLRHIIDQRLSGKSYTTCVQYLIKKEVPSARGGAWTESTVKNILTNPALCGYRMINGELVIDPKTGEPVVGDWETIATPEEWRKLARRSPQKGRPFIEGEVVRYNKKKPGQSAGRKHLLSEFLRCGKTQEDGLKCMSVMVGQKPRPLKPNGSYSCNNSACRGVSRRMDLLDKAITSMVLKVLEKQFARKRPEHKPWHGQKTLDSLHERKRALKAGFEAGEIQASDFFDMLSRFDTQISDSERDKREFEEEQYAKNFLAGFHRKKWEGFDLRQKRIAIGAVLSAVVVLPVPEDRPHKATFYLDLIKVHFKTAS